MKIDNDEEEKFGNGSSEYESYRTSLQGKPISRGSRSLHRQDSFYAVYDSKQRASVWDIPRVIGFPY